MNNVGNRIKEERVKLGITQNELATYLNVTRQSVSSWERNNSYPDIFALKGIADLFKLKVDDFLSEPSTYGIKISEHSSVENNLHYLAVQCPNCKKRHELEDTINEFKNTLSYRFACDCKANFTFDIRKQDPIF